MDYTEFMNEFSKQGLESDFEWDVTMDWVVSSGAEYKLIFADAHYNEYGELAVRYDIEGHNAQVSLLAAAPEEIFVEEIEAALRESMTAYSVITVDGSEYTIYATSYDEFLGAVYGEDEIVQNEDDIYVVDKATVESLKKEFPELVK